MGQFGTGGRPWAARSLKRPSRSPKAAKNGAGIAAARSATGTLGEPRIGRVLRDSDRTKPRAVTGSCGEEPRRPMLVPGADVLINPFAN